MSNFINYKSNQPVNLDLVCSIYQSDNESSMWFTFPSMNSDEQMDIEWKFDTRIEAIKIYETIKTMHSKDIGRVIDDGTREMSKTHLKVRGYDFKPHEQSEYDRDHTSACGYIRDNVTENVSDVDCFYCVRTEEFKLIKEQAK